MKIKIKNKEFNLRVTEIVLSAFFVIFVACYFGEAMSFWLNFTFLLNGIVILFSLFRAIDRRAYSFELVHLIFYSIFFWIAPVIQRNYHYIAWGVRISDTECVWVNGILLLWLVLFQLGQKIAGTKSFRQIQKPVGIPKPFVIGTAGITVVLTLIMFFRQGLRGLIADGGNLCGSNVSATVGSLFFHCVTAFITFTAIYSIRFWKKERENNRNWFWLMFLCLFCLVLTSFPTAISRYAAGSIYLCVAINLFPVAKKKPLFFWIFSCGMLLMFPVMDLYRYVSIGEVGMDSILGQILSLDRYFATGNYDAYSMLAICFRYITSYGYRFGKQLLGAILFFVPRALWPGKAISSGAEIAHSIGLTFDNISAPLPMEAFIDFGIAGIVVFAFGIGYLLRRVDNSYWQNEEEHRNSYIDILYCYAVPFFLFLCRGSLLSTWGYLVANMAVVLAMSLTCVFLPKIKWIRKK